MGEFQPKHPWMNGIQVCSYETPRLFPERNDNKIAKKNLLLQNQWANSIKSLRNDDALEHSVTLDRFRQVHIDSSVL